jgi:hypothetical protein
VTSLLGICIITRDFLLSPAGVTHGYVNYGSRLVVVSARTFKKASSSS